jgi:hypothetical protein
MTAYYRPADFADIGLVFACTNSGGYARYTFLLRRRDATLCQTDPIGRVREGHCIAM